MFGRVQHRQAATIVANLDEAIWLAQPIRETSPPDDRRPSPEALAELRQVEAARINIDAFAPLYEAHVDLVWRYAMSRLGNQHRASDATSITFQRAIAALPRFQPRLREDGTTFRAWLMSIARNVVIDEARRQQRETSLDQSITRHALVDTARSPEAQAIASDERRLVMAALDQLPQIPRQIVELRLVGMKVAEIADILGMSQSGVKTAHFRAYARLRDLLSPEYIQGQSDE
jgi:RNA polymerase sigma-70 factor (ECF subfamily)